MKSEAPEVFTMSTVKATLDTYKVKVYELLVLAFPIGKIILFTFSYFYVRLQ